MKHKGDNKDIKAVFFDLGKVLLHFDHNNIIKRLLSRTAPDAARAEGLFRFLFDAKDGLCNRYDEGTISSMGFFQEIDSMFALGMGYDEFTRLWNDIFTENTDVAALMRRVRDAGRPVYLLSNINELHWEFVKGRFPALSGMDGWVLSYEVKSKKPAPAIYRAALDMAGAVTGETVFIDDLEENTAAAASCGIRGLTFKGAGALESELTELGLIGLG
jgi:FMN phosphatase YigB (HAD superfamily)